MSVGSGDLNALFEQLKSGLAKPLAGMGTAFSASHVRPGRRAGAGLPRPHRRAGAEPLLQRAGGMAGRPDPAVLRRAGGGRRLDAGLRAGAAGTDRREHGEPAAHPAARRGRPRAGEPGGDGADRADRDPVGHDAHQPAAHAAHRRGAGGARAGAAAARRAAPRCGLRRCGARPSAQHRTLSAAPAGRCRDRAARRARRSCATTCAS